MPLMTLKTQQEKELKKLTLREELGKTSLWTRENLTAECSEKESLSSSLQEIPQTK